MLKQVYVRDGGRTEPPFFLAGAAATLFAIGLVAVVAMQRKGLWYDEAWSLFMAQHPSRWLYDAHPPLFYYLGSFFKPDGAFAGRLLNFLYLAIAAAAAMVIVRREPHAKTPVTIAAILLVANPLALYALIDFRSYALLLAAWGSALASFLAVSLRDRDFEPADWPIAAVGSAGIIIALNLHYLGAAFVGTMLGIFIISEWLGSQRRWALIHCAAGIVGATALMATLTVHSPYLRQIAQLEWSSSLWGSIKVVVSVLALLFCANLVALIAAVRRPSRFALACAVAIAATIVVALTINAMHGVLLRRYLMPLVPVAAALIGVQCRRVEPKLYAAMLMNALAVTAVYLLYDPRRNWDELGERIGSIVKACSSTKVVAVQNWRMAGLAPYPLPDQKEVLALGQGMVGKRFGFHPIMAAASPSRCPVVVWVEHYHFPVPRPQDIAARANVPGKVVAVKQSETGFIAIVR